MQAPSSKIARDAAKFLKCGIKPPYGSDMVNGFSEGVAVAVILIFIVILVKVHQSLLQQSVVAARRIQVVRANTLALLRDDLPDQVPPCKATTENGRKIFHA